MVNGPRKREGDQLLLRFPAGSDIRARLAKIAESNRRSLSAEIMHRLEFTLAVDVTVQDTGFDVGHGAGSAEWNAAMMKRQPPHSNKLSQKKLEDRVSELEARMAAIESNKKKA